MMLSLKLAYKNLIRAGLKTWLNALALSFAFVLIIFYNGLIDGWNNEARQDAIEWQDGTGQLLNASYDPGDPFTIEEGHGFLPDSKQKNLTPILVWQGTIYPQGRMMPVLLKGIDVNQTTIKIPTNILKDSSEEYPVVIGRAMATAAHLHQGDRMQLRWRDHNGTFDAAEMTVAGIFETNVPFVDAGQLWMPLRRLWDMTGLKGQVTLFVANEYYTPKKIAGWEFLDQKTLLKPLTDIINAKKMGGAIMYMLLLAIGLLVIFDTQALSIFRRQKEIGTYIAMGLSKPEVIGIFTIEGTMYSIFATAMGLLYGAPLFIYFAKTGISFSVSGDTMGIIIAPTIYPVYGVGLILNTFILLVFSAAFVSLLAAWKIVKMNPVEALKGKAL